MALQSAPAFTEAQAHVFSHCNLRSVRKLDVWQTPTSRHAINFMLFSRKRMKFKIGDFSWSWYVVGNFWQKFAKLECVRLPCKWFFWLLACRFKREFYEKDYQQPAPVVVILAISDALGVGISLVSFHYPLLTWDIKEATGKITR